MIRAFKSRELQTLYAKNFNFGLSKYHVRRVRLILSALDAATSPNEMDITGLGLRVLTMRYTGYFAVRVTGSWSIIFQFKNRHAIAVDFVDCH